MIRETARRLLFYLALLALPGMAASSVIDVCIACHGADGMGKSDPTYPVIAGIPAGHIEEALFAYVDGARKCGMEPGMCRAPTRARAGRRSPTRNGSNPSSMNSFPQPFG